jgi:flagellar biosynthesis protein FlhF
MPFRSVGRPLDHAVPAESVDAQFAALFGSAAPPAPNSAAERVEAVLRFHDAPADLVRGVLAGRRRSTDAIALLATGFRRTLLFGRLPAPQHARLMLIGPPAAGKTTMMAKLAARIRAPVASVFTTDADRPGGLEQLAEPLSVLGIEATPLGLDGVARPDCPGPALHGPVLIDTGGTDADQGFAPLGLLARALAVEPVLVLPATIDPAEAGQFAQAALAIGATKLLVARLDLARRVGGPLAAARSGLALIGSSVTPHFAFGLKPTGPTILARHLVALAERQSSGADG